MKRLFLVIVLIPVLLPVLPALELPYELDALIRESNPALELEQQRAIRNHFLRLRSEMDDPIQEQRYLDLARREFESWVASDWQNMIRSSLYKDSRALRESIEAGLMVYPDDENLESMHAQYRLAGTLIAQIMHTWLMKTETLLVDSRSRRPSDGIIRALEAIVKPPQFTWTPLPGSDVEEYLRQSEAAFMSKWLHVFAGHHLDRYLETMARYRTYQYWSISGMDRRLKLYQGIDRAALTARAASIEAFLVECPFVWSNAMVFRSIHHELENQLLLSDRLLEPLQVLLDAEAEQGFESYSLDAGAE